MRPRLQTVPTTITTRAGAGAGAGARAGAGAGPGVGAGARQCRYHLAENETRLLVHLPHCRLREQRSRSGQVTGSDHTWKAHNYDRSGWPHGSHVEIRESRNGHTEVKEVTGRSDEGHRRRREVTDQRAHTGHVGTMQLIPDRLPFIGRAIYRNGHTGITRIPLPKVTPHKTNGAIPQPACIPLSGQFRRQCIQFGNSAAISAVRYFGRRSGMVRRADCRNWLHFYRSPCRLSIICREKGVYCITQTGGPYPHSASPPPPGVEQAAAVYTSTPVSAGRLSPFPAHSVQRGGQGCQPAPMSETNGAAGSVRRRLKFVRSHCTGVVRSHLSSVPVRFQYCR